MPIVLFGGRRPTFKFHHAFVHVLYFTKAGQKDEDCAAGVGKVLVHGMIAVLEDLAFLVES